jgi:hypothetical protein
MPLDIRLDDVLILKKPHPCGANTWRVYRVGADIGLRCTGCDRLVMLPRAEVERRVRRIRRGGEEIVPRR